MLDFTAGFCFTLAAVDSLDKTRNKAPDQAPDPSLYDYHLPAERIAQTPARARDGSRLMRLTPDGGLEHHRFSDLVRLLRSGDLVVLNDTRVAPVRLSGTKPSGGRVELLFLEAPPLGREDRPDGRVFECLIKGGKGLEPGREFEFEGGLTGKVKESFGFGRCRMAFSGPDLPWRVVLEEHGLVPLPPYIKPAEPPRAGSETARRYQTVYAAHEGAVAAPTAGLHFTPELLAGLNRAGVETARLTLHVGYGTFEPLREHHLKTGRLHPERFAVTEQTAEAVRSALEQGRRVVAVGTTVVRVLEHLAATGGVRAGRGETELFIWPGFEFKVVGAMITNFHLPGTSLMMLVAALAGRERILRAYAEAVDREYRFYSFGDAMLIEP